MFKALTTIKHLDLTLNLFVFRILIYAEKVKNSVFVKTQDFCDVTLSCSVGLISVLSVRGK